MPTELALYDPDAQLDRAVADWLERLFEQAHPHAAEDGVRDPENTDDADTVADVALPTIEPWASPWRVRAMAAQLCAIRAEVIPFVLLQSKAILRLSGADWQACKALVYGDPING